MAWRNNRNGRSAPPIATTIETLINEVRRIEGYGKDKLISVAENFRGNEIGLPILGKWFKDNFYLKDWGKIRTYSSWSLRHFDEDPKRASKIIIDGVSNGSRYEWKEIVLYWKNHFEDENIKDSVLPQTSPTKFKYLVEAITPKEVEDSNWKGELKGGPHKQAAAKWMKTPSPIRALFYSLILEIGDFPDTALSDDDSFLVQHVQYLGKKNSSKLENYKPLIIPSPVITQMNRILRRRLEKKGILRRSEEIRVENLLITLSVLNDSKFNHKPLYVAVLNFKLSQETILHDIIFKALNENGVPSEFLRYFKNYFDKRYVKAAGDLKFKIRRGLPNGDCFSEPFFVLALASIGKKATGSGYRLNITEVRVLVHVGQMLIFANTENSLHRSVRDVEESLKETGLKISDSSRVFSTTDPNMKPVKLNDMPVILLGNQKWGCFGREFHGLELVPSMQILSRMIQNIRQAEIYPHQTLYLIHDLIVNRSTVDMFVDVTNNQELATIHWKVRNTILDIRHLTGFFPFDLCETLTTWDNCPPTPCIEGKIVHEWRKAIMKLAESPSAVARACATSSWLCAQKRWLFPGNMYRRV